MPYRNLDVSREGAAVVVRLDRPQKANALSLDLFAELEQALDAAERDPSVRGAVITGSDRLFSAGADLSEAIDVAQLLEALHYIRVIQRATTTLEMLTIPVVAAIRGPCMTGALELVLACDLRFAGESARFAVTSSRIGSVAGMGGTQRLPRLVGKSRASDILLTGRDVLAVEAAEIGLVDRVVPDDEVMTQALAWIEEIATRAPLSVALSKLAITLGSDVDLTSGLGIERVIAATAATTDDRREGMQAFLDKRAPAFRGR